MSEPGPLSVDGQFNTRRSDPAGDPPWNHPYRHISRLLSRTVSAFIATAAPPAGARVLDFGCGYSPYRALLPPAVEYVGADLPGNPRAHVRIQPDGRLPVGDASCDLVLSTQALEHVADPALYLREAWRVLRPGGRLLLTTHGIMVWHRDPVDYWRWTCEGVQRIVGEAGFQIERFEGLMGLAATGVQLFQDATARQVPQPVRGLYVAVLQSLIAGLDRLTSDRSRAANALVFALLCRRPD